jgi:hypothetical protein
LLTLETTALPALTAVLATVAVTPTAVVVTVTPVSTTEVAIDAAPLATDTTTQPLVESSKTRQLQQRDNFRSMGRSVTLF